MAALFSAPLSAAQWNSQQWYFDGGVGLINFNGNNKDISPINMYVRGGVMLNRYFNIGAETSFSVSADEASYAPGVDFTLSAETAYLRAGVPLGKHVMVYAQAGYSRTELGADGGTGPTYSSKDDGTQLGLGTEIGFGNNTTYLAINYSQYYDNAGVKVIAYNLGVGSRF